MIRASDFLTTPEALESTGLKRWRFDVRAKELGVVSCGFVRQHGQRGKGVALWLAEDVEAIKSVEVRQAFKRWSKQRLRSYWLKKAKERMGVLLPPEQ